ncbi:MAG: hypothetical protein QOH04_342, partial [Sphingomonadales bacterium]|nr:hypothetical protein [Sphingomonadales bacterium]
MRRGLAAAAALAALAAGQASAQQQAMDLDNPTCPKSLNWSTYRQMRFTLEETGGHRILKAEGLIDEGAPERLQAALAQYDPTKIDEIWVRSPGGDARAGNRMGKAIRDAAIPTRIPKGWACFSACN